ncbi:MAG: serine/threonine-protein kinase [Polyangiaceae bacterium]
MVERVKLRATVVRTLGDQALADTVTAGSLQRTLTDSESSREEGEPSIMPASGAVVGGQYRLSRRLGRGMFGSVYVAERTDVPEHRVALKIIDRAVYGERDVNRELVMLAAATHPHIVELKDHGMTPEYVWLTMPLYEGETLAERLERGCLSLEEAHAIFVPIAQGLAALHARGLRHQDVKPENIYLANFAGHLHPVLLDFGVAAEASSDFVAGTALFGAPEQLAALGGIGEPGRLSERMDSYCLGSTLLYALVGEKRFPGAAAKTPFDIVKAFDDRATHPLADDVLPELQGEPREMLIEALCRWLTKDPEERPDAQTIGEELDVLLEKRRSEERAVARGLEAQKTALLRVRLALAAAAVLVVGIALYGVANRRTLALAAELESVRKEGEASFDKLDTCIAAQQLSQRDLTSCRGARRDDADAHERNLAHVEAQRSDLERQMGTTALALKTCETNAEAAAATCEETQQRLEAEQEQAANAAKEREEQLTRERDAALTAEKTCSEQRAELEAAKKTCDRELASCRTEPVYPTPGGTPPPGGSPPPPPPPSDDPYP